MGIVGILGCGWLGLPLAKRLISEGYQVKGTTTKEHKIPVLKKTGITPFLISFPSEIGDNKLDDFLKGVEVLIIDMPPLSKHKEEIPKYYELVLKAIKRSDVQRIILTTSIAVFQETSDFPIYTELSEIVTMNDRSDNLYAIENYFSEIEGVKTTIVRLGGLYGEERHPANYLSGKEDVKNPYAPVNLTSQQTAIKGITRIIREKDFKEVFHLLEKEHPSRIFYYVEKCEEKGLEPPKFIKGSSLGKIVSSICL